jgi:predicted GNAT family N-acyltransferase
MATSVSSHPNGQNPHPTYQSRSYSYNPYGVANQPCKKLVAVKVAEESYVDIICTANRWCRAAQKKEDRALRQQEKEQFSECANLSDYFVSKLRLPRAAIDSAESECGRVDESQNGPNRCDLTGDPSALLSGDHPKTGSYNREAGLRAAFVEDTTLFCDNDTPDIGMREIYSCREEDTTGLLGESRTTKMVRALMMLTILTTAVRVDILITRPINIRSPVNTRELNRVQGAGTCLMQKAEEIARTQNKEEVYLQSRPSAVEFYQQFGYVCLDAPGNDANVPMVKVINKVAQDVFSSTEAA